MRIAVIGAGGVGGYYGARWLEAGNAVTFVARGAHLQALRERGMRVDHPAFTRDGAVACTDLDGLCAGDPAGFDVIVLTVKSGATREVAERLRAWFDHGGHRVPVLSMQNGVDNEGELAEVLGPDGVIGGFALRVATHVEAPGHITATGPGQVVTGLWPNRAAAVAGPASTLFPELVRAFDAGGTPVIETDDIRRELWRKLVINNGLNPVSALTGWDAERLSRNPDTAALIRRLMRETAAAARADHVELAEADIDEMFRIVYDLGPIKTSMLVDREQGRPLELDAICGAVLARARQLGDDAPATAVMASLLRNGLWHEPG
ncbi:ketopantoate reductase family protein [Aquisalimonas asiatica]|uniref:2-dehydropantoate 2-reductase n=1 Tax=Aquisalimonas asiatica TaxID=406100 RepID=A0A1H8UZQ2_9GAMM|nr:2-dehydropantoate 2-reductase [Aquisalimonas asiatica]SEP08629.1 2-dehydropantoate 2-reductase [Aquisalimonas asiatica]